MPRYRIAPRQWCGDDSEEIYPDFPMPARVTVHEENGDTDTGLIDERGFAIWRMSEKVPMGFCR